MSDVFGDLAKLAAKSRTDNNSPSGKYRLLERKQFHSHSSQPFYFLQACSAFRPSVSAIAEENMPNNNAPHGAFRVNLPAFAANSGLRVSGSVYAGRDGPL
jgi:hypothetical protein